MGMNAHGMARHATALALSIVHARLDDPGVAKALVRGLLDAAAELGYLRVRLETGERMPEALALYRAVGFEPIPCWGPYATDPRSRCFELALGP